MDNRYGKQNCPARMNDPRLFTSFTRNCEMTERMKKQHKISNSSDFRKFLQKNGQKIINSNTVAVMKRTTCNPGFDSSKGCTYCCN
jgi:hypothetical protein